MGNTAVYNPEEWVRFWRPHFLYARQPPRIALYQLFHEVLPFELDLSAGNGEEAGCAQAADLFGRKTVAAVQSLHVNGPQILRNEPDGLRSCTKTHKLRVVNISFRLSLKNGLGKKSFPPQGNESATVEVLRM